MGGPVKPFIERVQRDGEEQRRPGHHRLRVTLSRPGG